MPDPEVWYVSYGSNMSAARLATYLNGGRPDGASMTYAGAHDRTPPREDRGVMLPGRIYFAGDSEPWGGGVAFYDHDEPGPTPARAYRISVVQFADVAAQEMHRVPDPDDPLVGVLLDGHTDGFPDGRHEAGPGVYETLVEVGRLDGLPMLTFTAPHGFHAVPHTRPRPAYLATLAAGIRDAHGWSEAEIADYFARVGGLEPDIGTARPSPVSDS